MDDEAQRDGAASRMRQINRAWLDGRVEDLTPWLLPEIIMVLPGFSGRIQGRDAFLAGFADFCRSATIHGFREDDLQVDVAGDTAVATFRYEMVYERSAARYRATGRDLWVFQQCGGEWLAAWRTMLDLQEEAA